MIKNEIHEECGVFGVWAPSEADVSLTAYYGLYALQHRGQESAGIAVNDDGIFRYYRDLGLVNDVFTPAQLEKLHTLLKPLMLRRMKEDVEKSLKPKEETVINVEMTAMQKKFYRAVYDHNTSVL